MFYWLHPGVAASPTYKSASTRARGPKLVIIPVLIITKQCVICPKIGGRVEYVNACMQVLFIMHKHRVEQYKRVGRTLPTPRQITPCNQVQTFVLTRPSTSF